MMFFHLSVFCLCFYQFGSKNLNEREKRRGNFSVINFADKKFNSNNGRERNGDDFQT
jgi:hypothetical protein